MAVASNDDSFKVNVDGKLESTINASLLHACVTEAARFLSLFPLLHEDDPWLKELCLCN